jgi:hypothetical protein
MSRRKILSRTFFCQFSTAVLDKAGEGQDPERLMARPGLDAPDHRAILRNTKREEK